MKKKIMLFASVLTILVLGFHIMTNPTLQDFKEYLPSAVNISESDYKWKISVSRVDNNILWSMYEVRLIDTDNTVLFFGCRKSFTPYSQSEVKKFNIAAARIQ